MTDPIRAHRLKCWPEYFEAVVDGEKTCELRKADRDYRVGDALMLCLYLPREDRLTGDWALRIVTHILRAEDAPRGLIDGFVVMSLRDPDEIERAHITGERPSSVLPRVEWIKPCRR